MTTNLVPVNLSVADVHAAAKAATGTELPKPEEVPIPPASDLGNWAQEAYSLDVNAATSLGFPVGNLTANYKRQALMFGSSRWRDITANGQSYRFGVALRAIIVVSEDKVGGALTLPVLAAKVELEGARATAQLLVRGYKSSQLATRLPNWQSFGVDSYAQYMKAVSDIQQLILSDESGIQPELLATSVLSPKLPSAASAVGSVFALHAIACGLNLAQAIGGLNSHDTEVVATVQEMYRATMRPDQWANPSHEQRADARMQLYGLHVTQPPIWNRFLKSGRQSAALTAGASENGMTVYGRDT
jgi:hypothetical protein